MDEIRSVDKLLSVSQRVAHEPGTLFGVTTQERRVSSATRQRADRALARPRAISRRLRPHRRVQPAPGPTRRGRNPVHPRARHRTVVLTVAGLAVHRPLPAEQRPGRAGPPRLEPRSARAHPAAASTTPASDAAARSSNSGNEPSKIRSGSSRSRGSWGCSPPRVR